MLITMIIRIVKNKDVDSVVLTAFPTVEEKDMSQKNWEKKRR